MMEKFWEMASKVRDKRNDAKNAFLEFHFFQCRCSELFCRLVDELDDCSKEYRKVSRDSLKRHSSTYEYSNYSKHRKLNKIKHKMKELSHVQFATSVHVDTDKNSYYPPGFLRLRTDYFHKQRALYKLETEIFDYIFSKAMIPECYRAFTKLSVKHYERTVHFYINQAFDQFGFEHGHIVMDEQGRFVYVRWPNEPRGAQNNIEPIFPEEYFKLHPRF